MKLPYNKRLIILIILTLSVFLLAGSAAGCFPAYNYDSSRWFTFIPIIAWFPFSVFSIVLYLLPSILALIRRKKSILGIILVNVLTGWTGIGWIISLIWALLPN